MSYGKIGFGLLTLAGYEATVGLIRLAESRIFYRSAKSYAESLGKPLLVVSATDPGVSGGDKWVSPDKAQSLGFEDKSFGAAYLVDLDTDPEGFSRVVSEATRAADRAWLLYPFQTLLKRILTPGGAWVIVGRKGEGENAVLEGTVAHTEGTIGLTDSAGGILSTVFRSVLSGIGLGLGSVAAYGILSLIARKKVGTIKEIT